MSISSSINTLTIPAAVGGIPALYELPVPGEAFQLVEAGAKISVKAWNGHAVLLNESDFVRGTGLRVTQENGPVQYTKLELRNYNAFPVYIQIWCGWGEYIDTRTVILELPTETLTHPLALNQLGAGLSVTLFPPDATHYQRRSVTIANADTTNSLYLYNAANEVVTFCPPNASIDYAFQGAGYVKNNSGTPITCAISEPYYTVGLT